MPDLSAGRTVACVALVAMLLAPTALILYEKSSESSSYLMLQQGLNEFRNSNYGAASDLFNRSYNAYLSDGNEDGALEALNWKLRADRVLLEYALTREDAEALLAERFPDVPEGERKAWLDSRTIERIFSDGEWRYYLCIADNIVYRNLTLYHRLNDDKWPSTMLNDMMLEVLSQDANGTGTRFNPADYVATGTLTIERWLLPSTGKLSVWIPAPLETSSQVSVTVLSVEPSDWVRSITTFGNDLGQIYMEVPLDGMTDDIVVTVSYAITTYQVHAGIDPSGLGEYDRSSEVYTTYTASSENIVVNEKILEEARRVVRGETNPYLQALLLYDYVVGNISYSYTPHMSLTSIGMAESEYVRTNRYGDCGAQSMYYCALLRSLGIPARACGGYQSFDDGTGPHIWAEAFMPGHGWMPVDVAMANSINWVPLSDATDEERAAYQRYYFGNLDNMRYVIQESVDVPLSPEPGMYNPIYPCFQNPVASCTTSDLDVPLMAQVFWEFTITAEGQGLDGGPYGPAR